MSGKYFAYSYVDGESTFGLETEADAKAWLLEECIPCDDGRRGFIGIMTKIIESVTTVNEVVIK